MNWISIVELIILAASAILVIPQLFLLNKQLKSNEKQLINQQKQNEKHHEERRRENTVNFISAWNNSVKKDTFISEQVARQLNRDQCEKLYRHNAFEVSDGIKKDICKFCPLCDCCEKCSLHNSNTVDGKILTELRWHVITYLNTLEILLVSWDLGIIDKHTVEEQFLFLSDISKGETLAGFRHTAGGFPIIEKFLDEIKEKGSKPREQL